MPIHALPLLGLLLTGAQSNSVDHNEAAKLVLRAAERYKPATAGPVKSTSAEAAGTILVIHLTESQPGSLANQQAELFALQTKSLCSDLATRGLIDRYGITVRLNLEITGQTTESHDVDAHSCAASERRTPVPLQGSNARGRFDFKGVMVGDTAAMHLDIWGSPFKGIPACSVVEQDEASVRHRATFEDCDFRDSDISGIHAVLSASFIKGGTLMGIAGVFDSGAFEIVRNAFLLKYGKADDLQFPVYQNANGAQVTLEVDRWVFSDGVLMVLIDPKDGARFGHIDFKSNQYTSYLQSILDDEGPRSRVNF